MMSFFHYLQDGLFPQEFKRSSEALEIVNHTKTDEM